MEKVDAWIRSCLKAQPKQGRTKTGVALESGNIKLFIEILKQKTYQKQG
jgi:hypothetical protein